jgi:hypothetical protein
LSALESWKNVSDARDYFRADAVETISEDRSLPMGKLKRRRVPNAAAAIQASAVHSPVMAMNEFRRRLTQPAIRRGSVCGQRLAGRTDQLVCLDEDSVVIDRGAGKEANSDKCRAKQQAHQHCPAMRALIGVIK